MNRITAAILACSSLAFATSESAAIILYGKDNDGNQAAPASGAPWDYVARLTNSDGSQVGSSAVYLGWGYMLTADHVANRSHVTFDGTTNWAVQAGSTQQVGENADLKIFRLSEDPALAPLMLYEDAVESGDLDQVSTLVGWGVGRDPLTSPGTNDVPWGTNATRSKRWGTNTTDGSLETFSPGDGRTTEALVTFLDNDAGADEAAATLHDSGSALFQFFDDTWYLSGIAIGVTQKVGDSEQNHSRFGAGLGGILHSGDENYFARIATYSDDINAVIPEPSTWAVFAGVCALGFTSLIRRRKRVG